MNNNQYQLEERLTQFSEHVIELCKLIDKSIITIPIINQLLRSATSIGANYCEANNASSKLDFRSKIFICKKEAQETKYWLRLLIKSCPKYQENIENLLNENHEYVLIFQKIIFTMKNKKIGN